MQLQQLPQQGPQSPGAFSFPQPTASTAPAQQQLHSHMQPQQLPQTGPQSPGAFSFPQPTASTAPAQQQLHSHMQPQQLPQPHQSSGAFAYTFSFPQLQQQLHSHMQPQQLPQPHQSSGAFSFSQPAAIFGLSNFSTSQVLQSHSWNTSSVSQAAASSSSSPHYNFFSGISSQSQSQAIVSSSCGFGSASFSPDLASCYQTAQAVPDSFKTPISSPRRVHSSAAHSDLVSSFHEVQARLHSTSFEHDLSSEAVANDDGLESVVGAADRVDHSASYGDESEAPGHGWAPGADNRASSSTEGQRSGASTESLRASSEPRLPVKQMKAASKPLQFFTTIVVKSCLYVKEYLGFVGSERRAGTIFQKVESALRDRANYPLPPEVSLKDLMAFSYFQGPEAESSFHEYCVSKSKPLQPNMIAAGDKWYNNKFTDIRKIIANRVLPKFLSILKQITGDGKKSG
jgi:hypothetical protein